MAGENGAAEVLEGLPEGGVAQMGDIENHARPLHLRQQGLRLAPQTAIHVVAVGVGGQSVVG